MYLGGFSLGGRLVFGPHTFRFDDHRTAATVAARGGALLPVLLTVVPAGGIVPVWVAVFAGGYFAGSWEASGRRIRVSAVADEPYTVARFLAWEGTAVLRITGWPSAATGNRWRAPARILGLSDHGPPAGMGIPAPGQGVWLSGKGQPPDAASLITGPLTLTAPPVAPVPGGFDFRLFLAGRGLAWQGRLEDWEEISGKDPTASTAQAFFQPIREALVRGISHLLPAEEAGMAGAVLLGIRNTDSRRASRPFSDLGLAHLFAVSGLHVGILLGIVLLPGQAAGLSPGQKLIPLVLLLPVYVLLTGMPGSVVRASSLGFLALLAGTVGRPAVPLRLVGLLFWAGTIWDPFQNLDTGLKLSYLAAGGILALSSLTNGLRLSTHRVLGPVFTGLAVSGAAQWFTLPLVANSFGRISMLSPVANLVAVPVFGLAVWCVVAAMLLGGVWAWGAQSAAALGWLLFRSLAGLAGYVSHHSAGYPIGLPAPGAGRVVIWVMLTGVALFVLRQRATGRLSGPAAAGSCLATVAVGMLIFGPLAWDLGSDNKVTAWQFDVGQGDCGLLAFPDGWTLMIDTAGRFGFGGSGKDGPLPRNVLPFLRRNGLSRLDGVVLTHGHLDHTGGSAALSEVLEVGAWYVSGRAGRSLAGLTDSTRVIRPTAGRVLHRWEEWEVAVLYPPGPLAADLDENDRSLVVVLRRAGRDVAVWSGDLETEGEHLMLASEHIPGKVQVWKAGHHGSDTSGSPELMDRLDPELVLISCGVDNGYRHPSHGPYVVGGDTVNVARTDLQGTVRLQWSSDGSLAWRAMDGKTQIIGPP